MNSTLAVIIPTLNEAANLPATLAALAAAAPTEILVVDGGSTDQSCALAAEAGARVIQTPPGRAGQMNQGAELSSAELLLFVHADTRLPREAGRSIRQALDRPGVVGGAFSLGIDHPRPMLRLIAAGANLRSRLLGLPYGDQAIFTRRETFWAAGGFPQTPIMEDYIFIRRLGKMGRIVILPQVVLTSARRWQNLGILRTTLINQLIVLGYTLGIAPDRLARFYRRAKGVAAKKRQTPHA
ncbi:TIGR04283 family arsenosugar biosynthesis glycosyltransferase [Desulfogranum mediterraneum]|uniref:TIGR04283 family arsenosugar biosynthesis glycosyltransferase n=1 Tax=Desulfogranum mediterraneum TaxID=160661 RepID=UPI00041CDE4D|nr:TIGR04283 family arsenosugar biosynthesis glycosyltransferase [Desulfogranum mediterraneum]